MKNLAICFALGALAFGCKTSQDSASIIDAEGANIPVAECCASKSDCATECSEEEQASCSASEKASCSASESTCTGATEVN